ncbi:MAG: endonuclease domain-containing protein [Candidatus Helarchaeota archaeon]
MPNDEEDYEYCLLCCCFLIILTLAIIFWYISIPIVIIIIIIIHKYSKQDKNHKIRYYDTYTTYKTYQPRPTPKQIIKKDTIYHSRLQSKYPEYDFYSLASDSPIEDIFLQAAEDKIPGLVQQKQIGRYRVDFAIPDAKVIIECDGDYWHDSDKDYIRDEYLFEKGWEVIRFSGTEIYRDVKSCVEKVISHLKSIGYDCELIKNRGKRIPWFCRDCRYFSTYSLECFRDMDTGKIYKIFNENGIDECFKSR